jgi:hypothetical protein
MFLPAVPDGYLPQTSVNNIRNCGTVLRAKKSNTGVDLGRLGASLRRDNTVVSGGVPAREASNASELTSAPVLYLTRGWYVSRITQPR